LISTFEWTDDAAQRILRVAGFMRNKTQERIEELARERAGTAIDLALVEDGIEFGEKNDGRDDRHVLVEPAPGARPAAPAAVERRNGAPNGTLSVGSYANATGAFIGRWVSVGSNVVFRKDSIFVCP
jgi:hypothetical protein